jgi:hypothetical protein
MWITLRVYAHIYIGNGAKFRLSTDFLIAHAATGKRRLFLFSRCNNLFGDTPQYFFENFNKKIEQNEI